jgi:phosphate:Na+ symporter
MSVNAVLAFAGGVGLFLLGMKLMTDGLKVAAGEALRQILARWTSSIGRGVAAGMLVTALVQSSSAVIFAVIGFVNAGILALSQAIGVIYGAAVGTTFTGWLVALVGFKLDLQALALPVIAVGMLLQVTSAGRRAALGQALTGFGVFFLGIDVLKNTFSDASELIVLEGVTDRSISGRLVFVMIGVLLTVVMQSSSAAIAVVLTAAAGGLVSVVAAAAVVVGANIGTTSTGLLAALGATSAAKRAATAHLAFTVVSGAAALMMLPVLLWLAKFMVATFGLQAEPAVTLAVFHTLVSLLGLLLMLPATPALTRWLQQRYRSGDEDRARPRHLDQNVLATPTLALEALKLELARILDMARNAAAMALGPASQPQSALQGECAILRRLSLQTAEFAARMQRVDMPAGLAEALPQVMRVTQYMDEVAGYALELSQARTRCDADKMILPSAVTRFDDEVMEFIQLIDLKNKISSAAIADMLASVKQGYEQAKEYVLRAASGGQLSVERMMACLDALSEQRVLAERLIKARRYLDQLDEAGTETARN